MKVKIIRIGNSMGIRIPKALLEQYGLKEDAILEPELDGLVIRPIRKVRDGWAKAFQLMAANQDDRLLQAAESNEWDEDEWEWK